MKVDERTGQSAIAVDSVASWTGEQREILDVIRHVTDVQKIGDVDEMMEFMHPNLVSWNLARAKSLDRWEFERKMRDFLAKWRFVRVELTPIDLAVDGDVAVAHFRYRNHLHSLDGRSATAAGCWTATLVKRDGRWLILCWDSIEDRL